MGASFLQLGEQRIRAGEGQSARLPRGPGGGGRLGTRRRGCGRLAVRSRSSGSLTRQIKGFVNYLRRPLADPTLLKVLRVGGDD